MRNFLSCLVSLFVGCQSAFAQVQYVPPNVNHSIAVNILSNPDFELGKTRWLSSGGTHAINTATPLFDSASWNFTASAASQYVKSALTVIPVGLQGQNCLARVWYKGGDAGLTMKVTDGTNTIASQVLSAASVASKVELNFICPSTGSLDVGVYSTAAAALVTIDKVKLGNADNLSQVSQAQLLGTVTISGCTSYWSAANVAFTDYGVQTSCVYTTTGSLQAPATMLPGFIIPNVGPGYIQVQYESLLYATGANLERLFDGTTGTTPLSLATGTESLVVVGGFSYTSPQTNLFIRAQQQGNTTNNGQIYGTTANPGIFKVWFYPTQSQLAVGANCIGTSDCENTFSATVSSTGIVSQQNVNFINGNCTTGGGGLGTVFTCTFNTNIFSVAPNCNVTPVNGLNRTPGVSTTNTTLTAKFTAWSVNNTYADEPFYIMCSRQATDRKPQVPIGVLVGSVTSGSSGALREESIFFGGAGSFASPTICNSTPCTIYSQNGSSWVSSVSRSALGTYSINFAAGMFSSAPICFSSNYSITNLKIGFFNGITSSAAPVGVAVTTSGAAADDAVYVKCIGPK